VQVVVLLLLVAGLGLLVLGLITGSTPLVVGSIAASLLAAMAIVRYRGRQPASGVGASSGPAGSPPAVAPQDGRDGAALRTAERAPALASVPVEAARVAVPPAHAAAEPAGPAQPEDVASTHRGGTHTDPAGTHTDPAVADTDTDPDTGTGTDTDPGTEGVADADPAAADTDPPLRSRGDEPVWVVDGRPRYHLPGCAFLIGRGPEPVPLRQAVEDGFTPCGLCDPDTGLAAR
jgi:hypothetical protein